MVEYGLGRPGVKSLKWFSFSKLFTISSPGLHLSCVFSLQRSQLTVPTSKVLPKWSNIIVVSIIHGVIRTFGGHLVQLLPHLGITSTQLPMNAIQTTDMPRHGKITTSQGSWFHFFRALLGRKFPKLMWELSSRNVSSLIQVAYSELHRGNLCWVNFSTIWNWFS